MKTPTNINTYQKSFNVRLFGYPVFSSYYRNNFGWFRLFGKGLTWKNTSVHPLSFCERNYFVKGVTILKWRISILS
jgi:hypothetical protein